MQKYYYSLRLSFLCLIFLMLIALIINNIQIDRFYKYTKNFIFIYDYFLIFIGFGFAKFILNDTKENEEKQKIIFSVLLEYLFSILLLSTLLIIYSYYFILPSDIEELSKNIISAIIFSSNLFYFFNGYYFPLNELDFIPYYNLWFTSSIIQHLLCIYLIFKFFKITIKKILTVFLFSLFLYFYLKDSYELLTFYFIPFKLHLISLGILVFFVNKKYLSFNFNLIFYFLGLVLILVSFFNIDAKLIFNLNLFLGCLGTIFLIFSQLNFEIFNEIDKKNKVFYFYFLKILFYLFIIVNTIFYIFSLSFSNQEKLNLIYLFLITLILIFLFIYFDKLFETKKVFKRYTTLIAFIFVFSSSFIILKFEGFPSRSIYENVNLDGKFYLKEFREWFKKNNNENDLNIKNKKKILVIGDSNGANLYAMIKNEPILSKNYNTFFVNLNGSVNFLEDVLHLFKYNLDKIIISFNWDTEKILETKKFISRLNNIEIENIEIIATTQTPIFKTVGKRMTHLDKFILHEKRIPNLNEIKLLEKKYYQLMKSDKLYYQFNNEIKSWNTKYNVKILDKSKYICDHKRETCSVLTNNNYKIYWDSNHYTLQGIKYLSKNEYFRSFFNK